MGNYYLTIDVYGPQSDIDKFSFYLSSKEYKTIELNLEGNICDVTNIYPNIFQKTLYWSSPVIESWHREHSHKKIFEYKSKREPSCLIPLLILTKYPNCCLTIYIVSENGAVGVLSAVHTVRRTIHITFLAYTTDPRLHPQLFKRPIYKPFEIDENKIISPSKIFSDCTCESKGKQRCAIAPEFTFRMKDMDFSQIDFFLEVKGDFRELMSIKHLFAEKNVFPVKFSYGLVTTKHIYKFKIINMNPFQFLNKILDKFKSLGLDGELWDNRGNHVLIMLGCSELICADLDATGYRISPISSF